MKVAIIDYGLGNIFNIEKTIRFLGGDPLITGDPAEIIKAHHVILPGVGAFGNGMKALKDKGLDQVLRDFVSRGKYLLGICLGMQLLMTSSEEFGMHNGLNIISGKVLRFPDSNPKGAPYKIPHVGWSEIYPPKENSPSSWKQTILEGNQPGDFVYFVHSYVVFPDSPKYVLAKTEYGGMEFCSAIRKDNVFGCQFHPELSGTAGLNIYREFLKTNGTN